MLCMRKSVVCLGMIVALGTGARGEDATWFTDLSKAQAQAKTEHKLVLMDFNGSDWCPACKVLRKSVFSTKKFQEYAKQNLILVDVDFPHNKELPEKQKKANEALADKYEVEGLPTVVILGSDGKELEKKVGYEGETPKEYIAEIEKLKAKR
jgi:thioredoxin-related protein